MTPDGLRQLITGATNPLDPVELLRSVALDRLCTDPGTVADVAFQLRERDRSVSEWRGPLAVFALAADRQQAADLFLERCATAGWPSVLDNTVHQLAMSGWPSAHGLAWLGAGHLATLTGTHRHVGGFIQQAVAEILEDRWTAWGLFDELATNAPHSPLRTVAEAAALACPERGGPMPVIGRRQSAAVRTHLLRPLYAAGHLGFLLSSATTPTAWASQAAWRFAARNHDLELAVGVLARGVRFAELDEWGRWALDHPDQVSGQLANAYAARLADDERAARRRR